MSNENSIFDDSRKIINVSYGMQWNYGNLFKISTRIHINTTKSRSQSQFYERQTAMHNLGKTWKIIKNRINVIQMKFFSEGLEYNLQFKALQNNKNLIFDDPRKYIDSYEKIPTISLVDSSATWRRIRPQLSLFSTLESPPFNQTTNSTQFARISFITASRLRLPTCQYQRVFVQFSKAALKS